MNGSAASQTAKASARTLGMMRVVFWSRTWCIDSSWPSLSSTTIFSHASYSPALRTAAVSSSFAALLLTPQSPAPFPSRPVMRIMRSLVSLSICVRRTLSFFCTTSRLGMTLPRRAGSAERAARIWSDLSGLLNAVPRRRRAAAGFAPALNACWRLLRTDESPVVSSWKSGSVATGAVAAAEVGADFFAFARVARPISEPGARREGRAVVAQPKTSLAMLAAGRTELTFVESAPIRNCS